MELFLVKLLDKYIAFEDKAVAESMGYSAIPIEFVKKKKRSKKEIVYPDAAEIECYARECNHIVDGGLIIRYYDSGDGIWRDKSNNVVLNWKQKLRGVWFKPENRIKITPEIKEPTLFNVLFVCEFVGDERVHVMSEHEIHTAEQNLAKLRYKKPTRVYELHKKWMLGVKSFSMKDFQNAMEIHAVNNNIKQCK